jgi:hypothetical protein
MFLRNKQKMKNVDNEISRIAKMPLIEIRVSPKRTRNLIPNLPLSSMDNKYDYCRNFKSGLLAKYDTVENEKTGCFSPDPWSPPQEKRSDLSIFTPK